MESTTPVGHSKLGASSAYRWMACPGSVKLSEGIPKQTSEFAMLGTAAHKLAEICLGFGTAASDHIGQDVEGFEVDEDMAYAVQIYLDVLSEYIDDPNVTWKMEQRFHLSKIDNDLWGTNDFCAYDRKKKKLYVIDYKHGAGIAVEVENNSQLKYYAVGALQNMGLSEAMSCEVELVIVQPRANHKDGLVRRWNTTGKELLEVFTLELKQAAEATRSDSPPLEPGNQCRFCPAQGVCPALANRSLEVAKATFTPIDDAIPISKRKITFPEVSKLSVDDLCSIMSFSSEIDSFLKEVHVYAERLALSGTILPGYKLVQGRTQRKWHDEAEATRALVGEFGEVLLTQPTVQSVAQAEKTLKKLLGNSGLVEDALSAHVNKPMGKPTLVKESDKRPPISTEELLVTSPFTAIESNNKEFNEFFEV